MPAGSAYECIFRFAGGQARGVRARQQPSGAMSRLGDSVSLTRGHRYSRNDREQRWVLPEPFRHGMVKYLTHDQTASIEVSWSATEIPLESTREPSARGHLTPSGAGHLTPRRTEDARTRRWPGLSTKPGWPARRGRPWRHLTLDQEIEGSTPSAPANTRFRFRAPAAACLGG